MVISEINQNNFSKAIALLKKNNLPMEDISDRTKLFAVIEDNDVIGTIGIELYHSVALLRSLAVTTEKRSQGIANKLIAFLENFSKQNGANQLVLLTTTASGYFQKKGFEVIDRNNVPAEIKQSTEFTSTCPASAIVMKKDL